MQCVPSIRPRQTSSPPPPPHPGHIPPPPPVSGTMSGRGFIPPPLPHPSIHTRAWKEDVSVPDLPPPSPPPPVFTNTPDTPPVSLFPPPVFCRSFPGGWDFLRNGVQWTGQQERERQAMMIAQGVFSLGKGEKRSRHRGRGSRIIFSAHCKLDQIVPFVLKM